MRIAFLVLCHKNPNQINKLIETLNDNEFDFYLHIDRKSDIKTKINIRENIYILEENESYDIKCGQVEMIKATINLIDKAILSGNKYDYYWLISGQDFPVKSVPYIKKYLSQNFGSNYIDIIDKSNINYKKLLKRNELKYPKLLQSRSLFSKVMKKIYIYITGGKYRTFILKRKNNIRLDFYFGSQWWLLSYECIQEMLSIINEDIINYYCNCLVPDESFFQTIFMKTSFSKQINDSVVYLDWTTSANHPKTLTKKDYESLMLSDKLIARKFDESIDNEIINELYDKLKINR